MKKYIIIEIIPTHSKSDKGKIIQSGIHNDLLKVDGLYRDFYNQQSSSIETI